MFKKNKKTETKTSAYTTLEAAMAYLSIQFLKTKDVQKYYPGATEAEIMLKHFAVRYAITLNPDIFPTAPYIVNGELVGELYLIKTDKKGQREQLEAIWNYEEQGTVALAK